MDEFFREKSSPYHPDKLEWGYCLTVSWNCPFLLKIETPILTSGQEMPESSFEEEEAWLLHQALRKAAYSFEISSQLKLLQFLSGLRWESLTIFQQCGFLLLLNPTLWFERRSCEEGSLLFLECSAPSPKEVGLASWVIQGGRLPTGVTIRENEWISSIFKWIVGLLNAPLLLLASSSHNALRLLPVGTSPVQSKHW